MGGGDVRRLVASAANDLIRRLQKVLTAVMLSRARVGLARERVDREVARLVQVQINKQFRCDCFTGRRKRWG